MKKALLVAILQAVSVGAASAQPFPSKPLRILVPAPAGSSPDIRARQIGGKLAESLGQPVIVENRPGANGICRPNHELVPVSRFTMTPLVMVVNPSLGIDSVKEFLDSARTRPDAITYASAGPGSISHLVGEWVKWAALALLPEVPTTAEAGLPGIEAIVWNGIFVPAGTPLAAVRVLHRELVRAYHAPEVKGQVTGTGSSIAADTPEEFAAFVRGESAKWGKVIRDAGIKPD